MKATQTFHSLQDLEQLAQALYENEQQFIEYDVLSRYEIKFYKKLGTMINGLKRKGIRFSYDADDEVLVVKKVRPGHEYPDIMYIAVYVESGQFAFGGEETDIIVSTNSRLVIKEVVEWLNNLEPAVK